MVVFGFWIIVFFDFWLCLDGGVVCEFVVCVSDRERKDKGWLDLS